MSVKELQATLEILAKVKSDAAPGDRWKEALNKIAAHISQLFKVTEREVAILLRTDDGNHLKFVFPLALSEGPNSFPLASPSVAGEVTKAGRGVVDNVFAQTKHLSFYERMKLEGPKAGPIQKMLVAPLRGTGLPLGVIEVSRKGADAAAAGPDFTQQDLAVLTEIGAAVIPYLQQLKPKIL